MSNLQTQTAAGYTLAEQSSFQDHALRKGVNYFVFGEPTPTANTFVNNLIDRLWVEYSGNLHVRINDHLWPNSFAWKVRGAKGQPQYINFVEATKGIEEMAIELLSRLASNKSKARASKPFQLYKPVLWTVNDLQSLTVGKRESMTKSIRFCVRAGAGSNMRFIYSGLSPLPSSYGLTKADMLNSFRFYIGSEMARQGLKQFTYLPNEALQLQLQAQIASQKTDQFALVKMPGYRPFVMDLPAPGAFESSPYTPMRSVFAPTPLLEIPQWDCDRLMGT